MSRSAHVTKKALLRERKLAQREGFPIRKSDGMTVLEKEDLKKRVYKLNAAWQRQAQKQDAPSCGRVALKGSHVVRNARGRRSKGKTS